MKKQNEMGHLTPDIEAYRQVAAKFFFKVMGSTKKIFSEQALLQLKGEYKEVREEAAAWQNTPGLTRQDYEILTGIQQSFFELDYKIKRIEENSTTPDLSQLSLFASHASVEHKSGAKAGVDAKTFGSK